MFDQILNKESFCELQPEVHVGANTEPDPMQSRQSLWLDSLSL